MSGDQAIGMLRGKLGSIRRQVDRRGRFLKVLNDSANEQNDFVNWKISKEKHGVDSKREMYTTNVRKTFLRWRMLQKCLVNNRQESEAATKDNLYGQYGGRPINMYNQQIDYFIEDSAPAKQRKRKIRRQMKDARQKGKILDSDAVLDKITDYFQESWGVNYKTSLKETDDHDKNTLYKGDGHKKVFEERFRPKRMALPFTGKLLQVPSLKKAMTTPISISNRSKTNNNNHLSESLNKQMVPEVEEPSRRQTMERLLRKVECTRPGCEGYLGRTITVKKVLPPIVRVARSNSASTLEGLHH